MFTRPQGPPTPVPFLPYPTLVRSVVVANRITEPARRYLASRGWGWLDRRIGADIPLEGGAVKVRYVGHPDSGDDRGGGSPAVRADRKSTRLNSSNSCASRMPSSA